MIGRLLHKRYLIENRLGEGGMAVVYQARDQVLHRTVAVKVLREQFAGDSEFVERFRREALAAASLSHPNIVNVYDVGREGSIHFIVMEYVPGETLKNIIRREAPLSPLRVARIGRQVCEALAHAHEHGVIHRDIKPHNILITPDGRAKVTDFGIAHAGTAATLTDNGTVMGSVQYFSPEQATGRPSCPQSDLYAVGVVLYEMLTGRVPFVGDTAVAVALKHVHEAPRPPSRYNPDIPPQLERVVLRALAKDKERRYHTAWEMAADLDAVARSGEAWAWEGQRLALGRSSRPVGATSGPLGGAGFDPAEAGGIARSPNARAALPGAGRVPGPSPAAAAATSGYPPVRNAGSPGRAEEGADARPAGDLSRALQDGRSEEGTILAKGGTSPGGRAARVRRRNIALAVLGFVLVTGLSIWFLVQWLPAWLSVGETRVPDVTGMSVLQAEERLKASQLQMAVERRIHSNNVPVDHVVSQVPVAGRLVKVNRTVSVMVSLGPDLVTVPDLSGQTLRDVQVALNGASLALGGRVEEYSDQVPAGQVISQDPPANARVERGSAVNLVISRGPAPQGQVMPNLRGRAYADVTGQLVQMGLQVGQVVERESGDLPAGTVLDQDPEPGATVPLGGTVNLVISKAPGSPGYLASSGYAAPGSGTANNGPVARTINVTITVPPGPDQQQVQIVVVDQRPARQVYNATHRPGDVIEQAVQVYGKAANVQVYIDGNMVKEFNF